MAGQRGVALIKDTSGREVGLYKNSCALLIGVSDYTAGWPDLESIPGELEAVAKVLKAFGFNVEMHLNSDRQKLENEFEGFINNYGFESQNRLLFFFSGHGETRLEGRKGYLVPADAPVPANSVFTPAFIDGLEHRLADLDKDGYITGTELGVYLQGKVP